MKQRLTLTAMILASTILLTGCIDRDEANAILQKGCEAAATTMTAEPFKISEFKNPAFEEVSYGQDTGLRQVTLTAVETDGWLTRQKEYKCVFTEFLGFFNMRHSADLYRIELGNTAYGKGDGADAEIDKWLEIRNSATSAM